MQNFKKMKKIIVLLLLSIATVSCNDDFLDRSSLTQIAEDNFWQSEEDAFLALNGVYAALQSRSMYGGGLNAWIGFPSFDNFGDNAFNQFKWEGAGIFMEGTLTADAGPTRNIWEDHYRAIARANLVIQNVQAIDDDLIAENSKNDILGQAYFLRALLYFNLSVYYQDVPLITEPQLLDDAFVSKNNYAEVTAQVIEDLVDAVELLPMPSSRPASQFGYATKGSALGLLARVQLYNKNYSGENGVLFATQELLGMGYSLHPNYEQLFSLEGENSPEIVFSIRFDRDPNNNNGETFSATFLGTPKVDERPMPNLVNDYYATDGLPISESPLYNPQNERANRDPRAGATIYFPGDAFLLEPNVVTFTGNSPTRYGKRKYIRRAPEPDSGGVGGAGSQDFYLIRYADVLLMRAEALAETGDLGGAASLVNQVRARVNMPSVQQVEGITSQQAMIDIVRHERRVELALEGLRFMDLKRWGEVQQAFERAASDPVGPYNPNFQGLRSEFFPIPQSEIDVNPQLEQHPAW
jgi:hypothetical protein